METAKLHRVRLGLCWGYRGALGSGSQGLELGLHKFEGWVLVWNVVGSVHVTLARGFQAVWWALLLKLSSCAV